MGGGGRVVQAKEDIRHLINETRFANGLSYCTSTVYLYKKTDRETIVLPWIIGLFHIYMLLK